MINSSFTLSKNNLDSSFDALNPGMWFKTAVASLVLQGLSPLAEARLSDCFEREAPELDLTGCDLSTLPRETSKQLTQLIADWMPWMTGLVTGHEPGISQKRQSLHSGSMFGGLHLNLVGYMVPFLDPDTAMVAGELNRKINKALQPVTDAIKVVRSAEKIAGHAFEKRMDAVKAHLVAVSRLKESQRAAPLAALAGVIKHLPFNARNEAFKLLLDAVMQGGAEQHASALTALARTICHLPVGARHEALQRLFDAVMKLDTAQRAATLEAVICADRGNWALPPEIYPEIFAEIGHAIDQLHEDQRGGPLGALVRMAPRLPENEHHAAFNKIHDAAANLNKAQRAALVAVLAYEISNLPGKYRQGAFDKILTATVQLDQAQRLAPLSLLARTIRQVSSKVTGFKAIFSHGATLPQEQQPSLLAALAEAVTALAIPSRQKAFISIFDAVVQLPAEQRQGPLVALARTIGSLPENIGQEAFGAVLEAVRKLPEEQRGMPLTAIAKVTAELPGKENRGLAVKKVLETIGTLSAAWREEPLAALFPVATVPRERLNNEYVLPLIDAISQLSEKQQVKLLTELQPVTWELPRAWSQDVYEGIFSLVAVLSAPSQEQLLAEFMTKICAVAVDASNSLFKDIHDAILRLDKGRQTPLLHMLARQITMLKKKEYRENAASLIAGALARLEDLKKDQ